MTIPQSVHKFCKDDYTKIENYELAKADNFKDWCIHHRLELTLDNEYAKSKEDLIRLDMYYKRPYFELIFLKRSEHQILHNTNRKVGGWKLQFTEEHKKKISESLKGNSNSRGRSTTTAATKDKISKSLKNSSKFREFMKDLGKRNTVNMTGRHWYNDGVNNYFIFDKYAKDNYIKGRTYHHRRKK